MTTTGNFSPPGTPPCGGPTTRAALLALRAAGQLRTECHYVFPSYNIGTPGNVSAMTIEMHATSPTVLSELVSVQTTFSASAWKGIYDIDRGLMTSLTDGWDNTVTDDDGNALLITFPWHAGSATFNNNNIVNCSMVGWTGAQGTMIGNDFRTSLINIVAMTSGAITDNTVIGSTVAGGASFTFQRNTLNASTVTTATPTSFIVGNTLNLATVTHAGAGSFSFQNNTMLTGTVTADAATTANVTVNNNVIGGVSGGYRVQVVGKTANPVIVSGNRLFNVGVAGYDLRAAGTGLVTFTSSTIGAGTITLNGPGTADVSGLNAGNPLITSGPGNLGIQSVSMTGGTLNHQGSGTLSMLDSTTDASVITTTAPSTRGLGLSTFAGIAATITQSGTGSANADLFTDGTTFTKGSCSLSATAAGTPASTFQGIQLTSGGQLNVNDHTDTAPVTYSRIDSNAIMNLSGAGKFTNSRIAGSPVLTLSGVVTDSVIEGPINKTTAATNTFRYASKAFDDWV